MRVLTRAALIILGGFTLMPLTAHDDALSRRGEADLLERTLTAPSSGAESVRRSRTPNPPTATGVDIYGDLEILRRATLWEPWSLSSSSAYEWQTNPALSESNEDEGYIFRQSATLRYQHQWSDTFYTDASLQGQLTRYDEFDTLDFDRTEARVGLLWATPADWSAALANWVITAHGSWYRLSDGGDYGDELFENFGLAISLARVIPLGQKHNLIFSTGAEISLDASVAAAQRDEYLALVAWQARWSPAWESTLSARTIFYDYDSHDDFNYGASASLDRLFGSSVRVGLLASYVANNSDVTTFDYKNTTLGLSLRGQLTF